MQDTFSGPETASWHPQAFKDTVVLITGAGQGIGRALALNFASLGGRVALLDRMLDRAAAVAGEITAQKGQALAIEADVTDEESVAAAIDKLLAKWPRIDVLVNGAGSYGAAFRPTHETPVEEWDAVFASNVRGTFLCAKSVLPVMMQQQSGRIINISSNAGRTVSPLLGCSYTAAKAAVIGVTRHLSREYAKYGILVNTVAPGPVDGERVAHLLDGKDGNAELAQSIPIGRLARPQDIASAILFLASDAASFVTGAILDVSGGLVLA